MDKRAILLASDDFLKDMGIVAKGDILALRAFAESHQSVEETREKRKMLLVEKLLGRKKRNGTNSSTTGKRSKVTSESLPATKVKIRKVRMAWQHLNPESKRYVMVRESTGGGHREMALPCDIGYSEMISTIINLFFPNGESSRGQATEMDFHLGNFKCEAIDECFTLSNYIANNKLTRPRIYLMSKQRGQAEDSCVPKEGDDGFLEKSVFSSSSGHRGPDVLKPDFSSTPQQDDSGDEIVFKGYGLACDNWDLDDTVVDIR